jgi:hypothetical protein
MGQPGVIEGGPDGRCVLLGQPGVIEGGHRNLKPDKQTRKDIDQKKELGDAKQFTSEFKKLPVLSCSQ